MNAGWAWFVAIVTAGSIIGACWLMIANRRSDPEQAKHVWDGDLTELNNPLPRWWLWLFFITVAFSIAYLVLYPGSAIYAGTLRWSEVSEHDAQVQAADQLQSVRYARYRAYGLDALARDPEAMATAKNIFANTCAACHGSDARGAAGFPNLTDADWLHGGTPDDILQTVTNGRVGVMPPFGPTLGALGVDEVVAYVLSLSGHDMPANLVDAGKRKFEANCTACHGADGKGNMLIGAPNLTDNIWLYGGSSTTIRQTITYGRQNAMPAHLPILGPDRTRLMAAYVLSLSGEPHEPHER